MSIIGFHFVTGLLREAGWPRRKGHFNSTAVVDTLILDHAIDQMIDWAAALGAGRPTLALQTIANIFRDHDWTSDGRPHLQVLLENAKGGNGNWGASGAVAPHEALQPIRFAGADAHRQAAKGIMEVRPKWKGPTMDMKDFKQLRQPLEFWFLEGVLWGIGNPTAFAAWYQANFEDSTKNLDLMRQSGLAIDPPTDLPQFFADSEMALKNYEREIGPLPAIPETLLSDARAIGIRL